MDAAFKEAMALYSELSTKNPKLEEGLRRLSKFRATPTCGSASPKPASTTSCSAEAVSL
jgi:hypothetical protein